MEARRTQLLEDLAAAHDELASALARLPSDGLGRPALKGEWSVQEVVAHLGYWAGYAVEAVQAAERGTAATFGEGRPSVDEINATVARVARQSDFAAVRAREQSSFDALVARVAEMDAGLLDATLRGGETVERAIREDGVDHYREHASDLAALAAR
jgi:hypothetical protein